MTIHDTITFSLTFSGLSSALTVAHLHFAPSKVVGGVMIFLCCGGGSQLARRRLKEPSPGQSRQQMLQGPAAKG
jgi:hypothetical protein